MKKHRTRLYVLCFCLMLGAAALYSFLTPPADTRAFTCRANFVEHYPDETLNFWLTFSVNRDNGMLNLMGQSLNDPAKKINRRVAFTVGGKDEFYHLYANRNITLAEDTVDGSWLAQREPGFFFSPDKHLYLRILKQQNDNYVFIMSTLPIFTCLANVKNKDETTQPQTE